MVATKSTTDELPTAARPTAPTQPSRGIGTAGRVWWAACGAAIVMIGVVTYAVFTDTPVGLMVRDPNQVAQGRAWTGLVSTLGNGLWAVSIGVLVLAVGATTSSHTTRRARHALLALLALTTVLFLDDSLLLHDEVLPSIGIHEIVIMALYGAAGLATLVVAVPLLRAASALASFSAALVLFAVSIGVDLVDLRTWGPDVLFAVEDGAKFVGIGLWVDTVYRLGRYSIESRA